MWRAVEGALDPDDEAVAAPGAAARRRRASAAARSTGQSARPSGGWPTRSIRRTTHDRPCRAHPRGPRSASSQPTAERSRWRRSRQAYPVETAAPLCRSSSNAVRPRSTPWGGGRLRRRPRRTGPASPTTCSARPSTATATPTGRAGTVWRCPRRPDSVKANAFYWLRGTSRWRSRTGCCQSSQRSCVLPSSALTARSSPPRATTRPTRTLLRLGGLQRRPGAVTTRPWPRWSAPWTLLRKKWLADFRWADKAGEANTLGLLIGALLPGWWDCCPFTPSTPTTRGRASSCSPSASRGSSSDVRCPRCRCRPVDEAEARRRSPLRCSPGAADLPRRAQPDRG